VGIDDVSHSGETDVCAADHGIRMLTACDEHARRRGRERRNDGTGESDPSRASGWAIRDRALRASIATKLNWGSACLSSRYPSS
jgi:hypothetical protein